MAEIAGLVNPELNIVDARSILTQGGPFYRNGVVVDAHKFVLCGDIVATDAYCAGILHSHDPGFSTASAAATINRAESLGMGISKFGVKPTHYAFSPREFCVMRRFDPAI